MVRKNTRKLARLLVGHRSGFIALLQAFLVLASLVAAWLLRFDFSLPDRHLLLAASPCLLLIRLATFARFSLFHGWWRYSGVNEAIDILKAVATGSVLFWIATRYISGLHTFPRSVLLMEPVLTAGALAGVRLFSRALADSVRKDLKENKKVILIGAGFCAQLIIRELRHPGSGYAPIACVDDDRSKRGIKIHGIPVVGAVDQLPHFASLHAVDEVLIAVPSATGRQMRRFVEICEAAAVSFKTVPALREIISGRVTVSQLRDVDLEDLLGREPIQLDLESVRKQIEGRTVVVTGAAGSIGSELCRQVLEYRPLCLVCVDQSETGIFYLQKELERNSLGISVLCSVGDVRHRERMLGIFAKHNPNVVFHAAAYKHVPIMERNVCEAVRNNVFGLLCLLDVAEATGVQDLVLISSDKAVNPTSVMGATKRIGELILSARPANGMRCVSVRFGNVLGSTGSVVPVLREQLQSGRPLTITHPEITRFFMTTHEAVSLVLQAFTIGDHGDILVLDMGEPIKIVELAKNLIRLSGKSEDEVGFQFIGLRDGEKLYEQLFYTTEEVIPTSFEKIKRTRSYLNGWPVLQDRLRLLYDSLGTDGPEAIRQKIREIVPEYDYSPASEPIPAQTQVAGRVFRKAAGH